MDISKKDIKFALVNRDKSVKKDHKSFIEVLDLLSELTGSFSNKKFYLGVSPKKSVCLFKVSNGEHQPTPKAKKDLGGTYTQALEYVKQEAISSSDVRDILIRKFAQQGKLSLLLDHVFNPENFDNNESTKQIS